ncbi:hypothetical protein [Levilactobacillus parabrevis]|uniref:hypothetical protein n=1 Tax=Levilactobacillus parabrevis TaxID=357278 RepID=UPI0021A96C71|nr:hypothetical protein [Levilactobacillus parabrevis]
MSEEEKKQAQIIAAGIQQSKEKEAQDGCSGCLWIIVFAVALGVIAAIRTV